MKDRVKEIQDLTKKMIADNALFSEIQSQHQAKFLELKTLDLPCTASFMLAAHQLSDILKEAADAWILQDTEAMKLAQEKIINFKPMACPRCPC